MELPDLARSRPEPGLDADAIEGRHDAGSSPRAWDSRRIMRRLGELATSLSMAAVAYAIMTLSSHLQGPRSSSQGVDEPPPLFRPSALNAEEIFLPRAIIARVDDGKLRGILRDRDVARLDA